MSINHSPKDTQRHFVISNQICRTLLRAQEDQDWHADMGSSTPDVFVFDGPNLAQGLAKWRQSDKGTLPFLLCLSAHQDNDSFAENLTELMAFKPNGLILTDAKSRADCERLDATLRVEEAVVGARDGETGFLAMLGGDTAGFANAVALAHSSARLIAIGQDSRAIMTATGAKNLASAEPLLETTRSHIQLAAASARIPAFEVVVGNRSEVAAQAKTLINRGFHALMTDDWAMLDVIDAAFETSAL